MPRSTRSVRHPLRLPDLQVDPHNANRGTDRGRAALAQSLREHGAGRAVLIDRHGRIIAGNKTVAQAKRLNLPLRVVHADGSHLIAVQRDDLDLATDPHAKALAIAAALSSFSWPHEHRSGCLINSEWRKHPRW